VSQDEKKINDLEIKIFLRTVYCATVGRRYTNKAKVDTLNRFLNMAISHHEAKDIFNDALETMDQAQGWI
jgi:hypothetical protein